jgi:hypothetical protein
MQCLSNNSIIADIILDLLHFYCTLNTRNDLSLYSTTIQVHLDVVYEIHEVDKKLIKIARSNSKIALHSTTMLEHLGVIKVLLHNNPEIYATKDGLHFIWLLRERALM